MSADAVRTPFTDAANNKMLSINVQLITFVDEPLDVHEHVRERGDLLAVFEQLRQIVGDTLRVDRVHFRHFHGYSVE